MKKFLVLAGLVVTMLVLVAAKYDYLLEMGDKTVQSSECKKCHAAIYEDWSKNFHAKAYANDLFKKASKRYSDQTCIACHAAQQVTEERALMVRPVNKEEGVNCTTCHLRNNMMYGPYKLKAKHPSEQDESMLTSEFCAGCHMPTYQEWKANGSPKTCQGCHMPRVEGKTVQGFPLASFVPKRMIGQHLQIYEGIFQGLVSLTGQKGTSSVAISLTNAGAGHKMPTGTYGDYRMVLTTTVVDSGGKEVFVKEEVFSTQKGNGVPLQKSVRFEYPIPATVKGYQAKANLVYTVPGRPDIPIAAWNSE